MNAIQCFVDSKVANDIKEHKKTIAQVAIWTTVVWLLGHAYSATNAFYSHDSLMVYQNDAAWQVSLGRFFEPIYLMLRGQISVPWLTGMFSLLWLVLAISCVAILVGLKSKRTIALSCGILCVNATVIYTNATYLPWADIYSAAFFFSVFGVYLWKRYKFGWLFGSLSICISLGLYQSYLAAATVVFMLVVAKGIIDGDSPKRVMREALSAVATIVVSLILYWCAYRLALLVVGVGAANSYNSIDGASDFSGVSMVSMLWDTWKYPIKYFLHPETYGQGFVAVLNVVIFALSGFCTIRIMMMGKINRWCCVLLCAILILMPFGMNVIYFISKGMIHSLMIFAFFLAYIYALMVSEKYVELRPKHGGETRHSILFFAIPACLAAVVLCNIVYANQVYVKKDLEFQSTLSTMTRVVDRIELTNGYIPQETPVVFIGDFGSSDLFASRPGFGQVDGIGLSSNSAITFEYSLREYFQFILGYPINMLEGDKAQEYANKKEVIDMPCFPATDSVKLIDGVVIVKVSGSE